MVAVRPFSIVCLMLMLVGCAERPRPLVAPATESLRPAAQALDRPVIDFSRGGGGLPVRGEGRPDSTAALLQALQAGYEQRLSLPPHRQAITIAGPWPSLELLRVDVSGARVRESYKPRQAPAGKELQPLLSVARFEYIALPLIYENGATHWSLWANGASLSLLADEKGEQSLVLNDAAEGEFTFSVKRQELKPMMLAGARHHARGGFSVRDVQFELGSDGPRQVWISMRVYASWLLLPATFHIQGRMCIDEKHLVHLWDLGCSGEDLGGKILSGLIDSSMQKYNNKVIPLARWPGDRIEVKAVDFEVGEEMCIRARFGQRK